MPIDEFSQDILNSFNVPQESKKNRETLAGFGGPREFAKKLGTNLEHGLTSAQVEASRAKYGDNEIPESPITPWIQHFINSFEDPILCLLLVAACISLIIGLVTGDPSHDWIDGAAIFFAVFLVSSLNATNNYNKELQFRALEASSAKDALCSVIRNGQVELINPSRLVVGDVMKIQAGDMIPADSLMVDSHMVKSSESQLTGETEELKKTPNGDCFLLSSTTITDGEEIHPVVFGIGYHSQWGQIKKNTQQEAVPTPLQEKLEDMANLIGYVGMVSAVATFIALVIRIWVGENAGKNVAQGFLKAFILGVTIVVVAVPEGLPLAVTISLAYSSKQMYADQCMIRVLAACETMGNATNICSDKTGTLTENQMTVVEGMFGNARVSQEAFQKINDAGNYNDTAKSLIIEHCAINRSAYLVHLDKDGKPLHIPAIVGNKTEGALINMIRAWGVDEEVKKSEMFHEDKGDKIFAFNSDKKCSTSVIELANGSVRLYCKGASEWIIKRCTHITDKDGKTIALSAEKKQEIEDHINAMADCALRTLLLGHKDYPNKAALPSGWEENPPDDKDLVCDIVVGIIDPLRKDVVEAVRTAQEAGVIVRMVTGDNVATAKAIAKQCGILTEGGIAVEGPSFRKMTPAQVDAILPTLQVMARSSPEDKFLLVTRLNGNNLPKNIEEWQAKHPGCDYMKDRDNLLPGYEEEWSALRPEGGDVVGVTGDGTNDAPALKAADVGLSMGITGTKVAQQASDIVILDDKFSSIIKAILWGRSVYDNIRKFLQFQITVNVVALTLVFISAVTGYGEPLNAVQMLWVNLIMDTLGALALGTEAPTRVLLQRRPYKRNAPLLSHPMLRHIAVQSVFQLTLLFVLLYAGPDLFDVQSMNSEPCLTYAVTSSRSFTWNPTTGARRENSTTDSSYSINCASFTSMCGKDSGNYRCFLSTLNNQFSFHKLSDFEEDCLTCSKKDYTHGSIIFNAFIFCQVFNEFNSRFLDDTLNMFQGLITNVTFISVSVVTVLLQIMLIYVGDEFVKTAPINTYQWLITIGLGFLAIPFGFASRFIPVKEAEDSFFDPIKQYEEISKRAQSKLTLVSEGKSSSMEIEKGNT